MIKQHRRVGVCILMALLVLLSACTSAPIEEIEPVYIDDEINIEAYGAYLPFAEKELNEIYENMIVDPKMAGRWYIPEDDIAVTLYSPKDGDEAQRMVDAPDSAAYFFGYEDGNQYIGDHNNQGFSAIADSNLHTKAYMIGQNFISTYSCVKVAKGHNTGINVVDENGEQIEPFNGVICYTCDDHWTNVTIVYFQYIKSVVWDIPEEDV